MCIFRFTVYFICCSFPVKQWNDTAVARSDNPLSGKIPKRIPLRNAPLVRVHGQIRFSRIAKIAEENYIADFQEAIRKEYPHFQSDMVQGLELSLGIGADMQHRMRNTTIWRFFDSEKVLRVSLLQDAISLETAGYVSRDDFLGRLEFILESLQKTVEPGLVQRVGIRYVDRLGEDHLNVLDSLVQPELLTVLQPGIAPHIEASMTEITGTTREGRVIARYGLVPANFSYDPDIVLPAEERSWVLDVDSFSSNHAGVEFDAGALRGDLDNLAARAYAFFRWSVTEEFLEKFGASQ